MWTEQLFGCKTRLRKFIIFEAAGENTVYKAPRELFSAHVSDMQSPGPLPISNNSVTSPIEFLPVMPFSQFMSRWRTAWKLM